MDTPPTAPKTDSPPAAPGQETPPAAPRDMEYWARHVGPLTVGDLPSRARNLNVDGRKLTSPVQGFGKMWQKTYLLRLEGAEVDPEEAIAVWRARFPEFWPKRNWFFGSLDGIKPGDVAVLNLSLLGMPVSTGVLVLYADDTTFTVMTPEGHQFAGFNTFSAHRDGEATCIQIQALVRASDPIYEVALPLVGHRLEDRFWRHTLRALAAEFGVEDQDVSVDRVCVDDRRQWRRWRNVWRNAAIRSILWLLATPLRLVARPFRRSGRTRGAAARENETGQMPGETTRPQAPILVLGRDRPFLDVQPTLREAEHHLARELEPATGHVALDACEYYDGIARPLLAVKGADGAVTLELAPGAAHPERLRDRINDFWASTQGIDMASLPADCRVDEEKLQPLDDEYSFARFVDVLDQRFNDDPNDDPNLPRHVGGRLHNFWHAVAG